MNEWMNKFRRKADPACFESPTILQFYNSTRRLDKTPSIIQYGLRLFGRQISRIEATILDV